MSGIGVHCSVDLPGVVVVGCSVLIVMSVVEPFSGNDSDDKCWVSIIPGFLRVD